MRKIRKIKVSETLNAMQVGDEVSIGYRESATSTIRAAACMLNKTDRQYKVVQSNKTLTTVVTRLA